MTCIRLPFFQRTLLHHLYETHEGKEIEEDEQQEEEELVNIVKQWTFQAHDNA